MSLILEALKKAEAAREAMAPTGPRSPRQRRAGLPGRYGLLVGAAVLLIGAALTFAVTSARLALMASPSASRQDEPGPVVSAPPAPPRPPAVARAEQRGESGVTPTASARAASKPPERMTPAVAPSPRASALAGRADPPARRESPPPSESPSRPQLPPRTGSPAPTGSPPPTRPAEAATPPPAARPQPPAPAPAAPAPAAVSADRVSTLKLQALVYSDLPAQRMVFINGRKYVEGQTVDGDMRVERITEDGVVLGYQGRQILLKQ